MNNNARPRSINSLSVSPAPSPPPPPRPAPDETGDYSVFNFQPPKKTLSKKLPPKKHIIQPYLKNYIEN